MLTPPHPRSLGFASASRTLSHGGERERAYAAYALPKALDSGLARLRQSFGGRPGMTRGYLGHTLLGTSSQPQGNLIRGPSQPREVSAVTAQTSASSRSGERPSDRPSGPKSHNSSSSAAKPAPTCFTFPCA